MPLRASRLGAEILFPEPARIWLGHDGIERDADAGAAAEELGELAHLLLALRREDGAPDRDRDRRRLERELLVASAEHHAEPLERRRDRAEDGAPESARHHGPEPDLRA